MNLARTSIPLGLVGVVLACTTQLQASDCAQFYIHHATKAPTDFGKGHVVLETDHAGYHNPSDAWGAAQITLFDCAGGAYVEARVLEQDDSGRYKYDVSDNAQKALDKVREGEPEGWMTAFEKQMRRVGARIRDTGTNDQETCGCRAFYPELRGNKKPYKA